MEPGKHTRASTWLVIGLAVAHGLITVLLARARYLTVHHHTYDLALYARLAWGLAHGQAWDPLLSGGALGGHLSLVLAPLGVLGAVFGTVPVLLVAQSAAFAATAWPLSQLAVRRAGAIGSSAGVLVALAWLLQPNLGHVASYEFHPGSLAVLPLACALELADREHSVQVGRALLLACALAVACRASLALQTLMLGLVLLRTSAAWRRQAALLSLASAAWFGLWLMSAGFSSSAAGGSLEQHFGIWGGSPLGALVALFTDPAKLFAHLSTPERLLYPLHVLLPLALLPLLSPAALLVALPPLALNLLSEFPTVTRLDSHYLTPALPALAWGAVIGAARLAARVSDGRFARSARLAPYALLALAALVANLLVGGMPWSNDLVVRDFRPGHDTAARSRVLAAIGPTRSVQAPDALLPHLIERAAVFRAPPPERKADVVVLDVTHRRLFAHQEDLLRTEQEPVIRRWLARDDHQVVLAAGDQLVLFRGRPPRAGLARKYIVGPAPAGRGKRLAACLELRSAALQPHAVLLELVARGPCPSDLALRLGVGLEPTRVDLLFDGVLSPAHLRAGDHLRSRHTLDAAERAAIASQGLHVGALRSSGARPEPNDPISVLAPLH